MQSWIDGSLYPDTEVPEELRTTAERIDFLARLCAAWDFGILPYQETVNEIKREEWKEAVDKCQLLTSPVYHLLREWHELEPQPYLGEKLPYIAEDPNLSFI
jgi:hypothetical protein